MRRFREKKQQQNNWEICTKYLGALVTFKNAEYRKLITVALMVREPKKWGW